MIGSADQMLRPRVRFGKRENSLQCIVKRYGRHAELKSLVPRSRGAILVLGLDTLSDDQKWFARRAVLQHPLAAVCYRRWSGSSVAVRDVVLPCMSVRDANRDSTDRGGMYLPQAFIKHNHGPCFGAERFRLAPPFLSLALMDILAYGFAI